MKSDESKIDPNFNNDKIPKEGRWSLYFFISNTDYVLKRSTNYYSQVFLGEWKYFVKEKKLRKYWRKGKKRSQRIALTFLLSWSFQNVENSKHYLISYIKIFWHIKNAKRFVW